MTSRRAFLTANLAGAAEWALAQKPPLRAEVPAPRRTEVRSRLDFWNDWPDWLTEKMNQARRKRHAALAEIRSAAGVRERARLVRSKVWELIGGPLERTPLNPQIAGTIQRGAYRIEKVIFESQPQVYVTANLYIPNAGRRPFPAILAPLGHADEGKAYRNYQYFFQNLARQGYVVLAYDPYGQGERLQYIDPGTGGSRFGPTGEHSQAGRPLLLLGNSFALYRAWDGIRALDYLLSRPEVDSQRVGCTGHSGGGTMTMYLCALEPRIQAAVVSQGNSENVAGPYYDPPGAVDDAEQNLIASLPAGIDRGDLLWAFAPKPLLLAYTSYDEGETYSPVYEEATREIYGELQQAYALLGAQQKVGLFASHLPHDLDWFQRRAAYDWFNRWLGNAGASIEEADFDASPPGSLNCTRTGQVLTSLQARSVVQLNADRARQLMPESPFCTAAAGVEAAKQAVRTQLAELLALPQQRAGLQSKVLSSQRCRKLAIDAFEIESEPGLRITGWFVKPLSRGPQYPTVLYLTEDSDRLVAEPSPMEGLFDAGYAVCAVTLRGLGTAAPRFPRGGPQYYSSPRELRERFAWASLCLGQPVIGQRVGDTLRTMDYLATRPDVARSSLRLLGTGPAGLVALMAAVLDERTRSVLLSRTLLSYASLLDSEDYVTDLEWFTPGILRKFDLPDLGASLSPRPCWIVSATDPRGQPLPASAAQEHYVRRLGEGAPPLQTVRFVSQPERREEAIYLEWLAQT
jgi:cephalosporin-C deacetylase-like acetyl esterase